MEYPQAFIEGLNKISGLERQALLQAIEGSAPTSIRINPAKLNNVYTGLEKVLWSPNGYYLPERPLFTADPLLHAGAYYVQEASSMFTGYLFDQLIEDKANKVVLDLCAAPGGKSTNIASMLGDNSLLVANEVIKSRANILTENIIKWGTGNVVVTNNDPRDLYRLPAFFDVIIVDAPCSGEGLFRKDKEAIKEWSPDNVQHCAARQNRIVEDIWPCLKSGGYLIYSTCTYNEQENEQNIKAFLDKLDATLIKPGLPAGWGITESEYGYRFYPHKTKGEGFFAAVLQKTGPDSGSWVVKKRQTIAKLPKAMKAQVEAYLLNGDTYEYTVKQDKIVAYPAQLQEHMTVLAKWLKVQYQGVSLGQLIKDKLLPDHALALSTPLNKDTFEVAELDYQEAVKYLCKEAITPPNNSKGHQLVTFKGVALGWIKNLGNRVNNNYPKEWRIRKRLEDVLQQSWTLAQQED